MRTSLIAAGRCAAGALALTMAMAQAHAAQAREWKEETRPKERAEKKALYEQADKTIRKYINWPAIETLAIESYQKQLDEADVRQMIVHAQGPVGQPELMKVIGKE